MDEIYPVQTACGEVGILDVERAVCRAPARLAAENDILDIRAVGRRDAVLPRRGLCGGEGILSGGLVRWVDGNDV